jgi:uncharacterized membrane protein YqhA
MDSDDEYDPELLEKNLQAQSKIERGVEKTLWSCRYIVLLAVVFGLISAISLFIIGSYEVVAGLRSAIMDYDGLKLVGILIGAVDFFLIGIVFIIFAFGVYELFISHLEIGRLNREVKILEIKSLDDLKNRILKVVIMVLIVSFFKKILPMEFDEPLEMLYFAASIFVLCLGVYFMHKDH